MRLTERLEAVRGTGAHVSPGHEADQAPTGPAPTVPQHQNDASAQDAFPFDYSAGVDTTGKFLGKPVPTGVRPRFTDRFDELGITLSPAVFGAGGLRGLGGRR